MPFKIRACDLCVRLEVFGSFFCWASVRRCEVRKHEGMWWCLFWSRQTPSCPHRPSTVSDQLWWLMASFASMIWGGSWSRIRIVTCGQVLYEVLNVDSESRFQLTVEISPAQFLFFCFPMTKATVGNKLASVRRARWWNGRLFHKAYLGEEPR